jgi:transposase
MDNVDYKAENKFLKQQISAQQNEIGELKKVIAYLHEQVSLSRHKRFGASSEQSDPAQLTMFDSEMFNEIEKESDSLLTPELEEITYKRKKKKGKREQDFSGLPVEQVVCELPEGERCCPECGETLSAVGQVIYRRELTIIPAQYKVTEYVQTAYACKSCEKNNIETPMVKADVPAALIPNSGVASPSLAAYIAANKFALSLPLYRQEQELKNNHVKLSRQTMANWMIYIYRRYLKTLVDLLVTHLLAHDVLHGDETPVQVLREDGKKAQSKSYMWVTLTSGESKTPTVFFKYSPNRGSNNPEEILQSYNGYLHTDGYHAYRGIEGVTVVGCFAHVRRYYYDALKSLSPDIQESSPAQKGVQYCDALFALERKYDKERLDLDYRKEQRKLRSKPLVDEFFSWAESELERCINTKSSFGKALVYTVNQKQYLMNFLMDGRLELSNNRAENAIRPFVVGRKNWLFCTSPNGAEASAAFYSIIETAKANKLIPFEYLKFLFENMPKLPVERYCELLPWSSEIPAYCKAPVV